MRFLSMKEPAGKYPLSKACPLQIPEQNLAVQETLLVFIGTEHLPKFCLACSGRLRNPQGLASKCFIQWH